MCILLLDSLPHTIVIVSLVLSVHTLIAWSYTECVHIHICHVSDVSFQ